MRSSTIRVTTKVGEGENQKRYGAKKEIQVPDSLNEALEKLGETGVLNCVVEKIEADETAKLRQKLVAKVQGKEAPASDVEEVTDLD